MKVWTKKLACHIPPMWLTAALAAVAAAVLLFAYVNTLAELLRQGDQLRQAQAAAAKRPVYSRISEATTARIEQLRLR